MKPCLFAILCCLLFALPLSRVSAQASDERCNPVDLDALKIYADTSGKGWLVHDVTHDWAERFSYESDARFFAEVLKAYGMTTYCKRFVGHNNTLMQYGLTSDRQSPKAATLVRGENCLAFDPASLKVVWSDEKSGYILTDGKTKVVDSWYTKGDLEDILKTVKTYGFGARCLVRGWLSNGYEYWKRGVPVYAVGRTAPVNPAVLGTLPKTPKPAPPDPLKEWVPVDFDPGPASASLKNLSLAFGARSAPALLGINLGAGKLNILHLFVRGKDNALWVCKMDKGKWGTWESLGGVLTSAPAAATWDGNTAVVVVRSADNAVWFRRYSKGVWEGWKSLGGVVKGDPIVKARWVDRYDVFAVGGDDAMWTLGFDGVLAGTWNAMGKATSGSSEVGFKLSPAAIVMTTSVTYLFAVGIDENLYLNIWKDATWKGWKSLAGFVKGTPSIYRSSYGEPIVLYSGPSGEFWGTLVKSELSVITRSLGASMLGRPAAIAGPGPFEFDVYTTTSDEKIWWRRFSERIFMD